MIDRILARALWLTIIGLITAAATAGLLLCFRGIVLACGNQLHTGGMAMGVGAALTVIAYLLARHGDDLMDR